MLDKGDGAMGDDATAADGVGAGTLTPHAPVVVFHALPGDERCVEAIDVADKGGFSSRLDMRPPRAILAKDDEGDEPGAGSDATGTRKNSS